MALSDKMARFDRDKIQKIVTNLLSNAYKFAPQNGRVDVSVGIGDGRQAMDCIRRTHPDLVLTDVMMPVMDGNELCRCIKADNSLKSIPVVMLTARLSDENEIESRECGADDYIKSRLHCGNNDGRYEIRVFLSNFAT